MSVGEILPLLLGGGLVGTILTAFVTLSGKSKDILHASEVEFRKALLARIDQLERNDEAKSKRIAELEAENRLLRIELDAFKGPRDV